MGAEARTSRQKNKDSAIRETCLKTPKSSLAAGGQKAAEKPPESVLQQPRCADRILMLLEPKQEVLGPVVTVPRMREAACNDPEGG